MLMFCLIFTILRVCDCVCIDILWTLIHGFFFFNIFFLTAPELFRSAYCARRRVDRNSDWFSHGCYCWTCFCEFCGFMWKSSQQQSLQQWICSCSLVYVYVLCISCVREKERPIFPEDKVDGQGQSYFILHVRVMALKVPWVRSGEPDIQFLMHFL